jgi:hypothetical protein
VEPACSRSAFSEMDCVGSFVVAPAVHEGAEDSERMYALSRKNRPRPSPPVRIGVAMDAVHSTISEWDGER